LFTDFIQTADAEHIRGTECDQKILSKKESRGQVSRDTVSRGKMSRDTVSSGQISRGSGIHR